MQAREALDHVRRAGRTVLRERATVLAVRREGPGEVRYQAPGPDGVDDRAVDARRAGHTVTLRVSGTAPSLPPVVDLAALGLLQESLSSAREHGSGTAVLSVAHTADRVTIGVTNPARADRAETVPGHGPVGVRRRVTTAGGLLEVGPLTDGTFRVNASCRSSRSPREVPHEGPRAPHSPRRTAGRNRWVAVLDART